MLTLSHKPQKQNDDMCSPATHRRSYYKDRAVAFAQLPDNVRSQRFPQEFAAIALAEVFGIENPVMLPATSARR